MYHNGRMDRYHVLCEFSSPDFAISPLFTLPTPLLPPVLHSSPSFCLCSELYKRIHSWLNRHYRYIFKASLQDNSISPSYIFSVPIFAAPVLVFILKLNVNMIITDILVLVKSVEGVRKSIAIF